MPTPTPDEPSDPFEAHFHRDPLPGAAVRVVVLAHAGALAVDLAGEVGRSLAALLARRGRHVEAVVVPAVGLDAQQALLEGLRGATAPLVLVTTALEPWTEAHLDP